MEKQQSRKLSIKWFGTWLKINGYELKPAMIGGVKYPLVLHDSNGKKKRLLLKDRCVDLLGAAELIRKGPFIERPDWDRAEFYVNTFNSEGRHFFILWDLSKINPTWQKRLLPASTFKVGCEMVEKTITLLDWRKGTFFAFTNKKEGWKEIEAPLEWLKRALPRAQPEPQTTELF